MENTVIRQRIQALREELVREHIDFYLVPTADFHSSEYVNEYFKMREFLSGFTGSNGTLVVSAEEAGLWTDGRYFIQAEKELAGTGIRLFRMQEAGVPTVEEYLAEHMPEGGRLGFDGRVVDAFLGKRLEERLSNKNITFAYEKDIADAVWGADRPALPCGRLKVLPKEICGESSKEKLSHVRKRMTEQGTDAFLLSKLDDIMWLYNVRGSDVACNPVALSYTYITKEEAVIFLQKSCLDEEAEAYFTKEHIEVREYDALISYLDTADQEAKILIDPLNCSYLLYKAVQKRAKAVEKDNPTELLKAVKNPVELHNMEEVYRRDSAALTKFIYWLKKNIGKTPITEISAAEYLDNLRSQVEGFLELAFPTIAGYKENAAMMHYEATQDNHKELAPEGMLLVDSGGQYIGGTTDVTRTIVLGEITDEMKKHFTAVVCGMLQLSDAHFLYGCTGRNLDILAREPLWNMNIDYKCGTGHGIGYILNVHEGPQNIRWRFSPDMVEVPLKAGMVVSNEPGVYIEGSHGIRIENIMTARNGEKNGDGQFMYFDTLTYVPIDREGIDTAYMSRKDIERLNAYHQAVYDRISEYLEEEERTWLKEVTAPIRASV